MKNTKAFIFDMDGLILDTERIAFRSYKEALKEYGYDFTAAFFLTLVGTNVKLTKELCLNRYGSWFPFDLLHENHNKITDKYIKENGVPLKEGVNELIDYLKENEYKIALATSSDREKAEYLLELVEIKDKFDYIICGNDIVNSKPNPEIFLKVAENLKVEPKECIVIEDSKTGIQAAVNAGMKAINVPDMKKPDNEVKSMAFKIFNSLLDVKEYISK